MNDKICILILAHNRIPQLNRLLHTLQHPDIDLYLHLDAKADPAEVTPCLCHMIPEPLSIRWGGFSQTLATLKLMRQATAGDVRYRYYVLISGVDYPLWSNQHIVQFFNEAEGQFLHSFSDPDAFWHDRYRKHHFMDTHPLPRRLFQMIGFRLQGRLLPYRKKPFPHTVHFGHTWWSLTHNATQHILDFVAANPDFVDFFRPTHASDEMFFHTILAASPFADQIKPELNYTDWSAGGSHPKILLEEDMDALKASQCLFARKFFMDQHPKVLDRVDQELRSR